MLLMLEYMWEEASVPQLLFHYRGLASHLVIVITRISIGS